MACNVQGLAAIEQSVFFYLLLSARRHAEGDACESGTAHASCAHLRDFLGSLTPRKGSKGLRIRSCKHTVEWLEFKFIYDYEQIKRELKRLYIYRSRCNERLKAKTDGPTRLADTQIGRYIRLVRPLWLRPFCLVAVIVTVALRQCVGCDVVQYPTFSHS